MHRLLLFTTVIFAAFPASLALADRARVLEQLRTSQLRFDTPEKWSARRKQLREEFLKGAKLWPLPERPPVKVIRHSRREHNGYSVENIAIETLPGFYCTGNLYQPIGRKELGPAILCPHGHFRPLGRYRENHQIRCAHLARMGATVFSYSMVGWQDSTQTTHEDPMVLALQTWNSIRAVDFVSGLQRVDPNRIAVTGASGGGTQSFFLTLVDDRIKASAPLVIVYPWSAPEGCRCEGGLPVMRAAETNAIELAAAAAPRPQLLISVGNDPTRDFPQVGFPFIKRMYAVAGAEAVVKNLHLAKEGHDYGATKRKLMYEFFAQHLRMQRNAFVAFGEKQPRDLELIPEDLRRIKIETPAAMAVFDDKKHPAPENSLQGGQAIASAFESHLAKLRAETSRRRAVARLNDAPRAEYAFKAAGPADEHLIFTPAGFNRAGEPRVASGPDVGKLRIIVRDTSTGKPTFCRVNVVGPDGHYYEPAEHKLKAFSLTGVWPKSGWGNRQGKAPVRYLGRYFYSNGQSTVSAPAGTVRVEVWKGFEFKPATVTTHLGPGRTQTVVVELQRAINLPDLGYWSGDPHIHIQRLDAVDDDKILDLMEAEDIHYGTILTYNNPAGPYSGFMKRMEAPQLLGLGKRSIRNRNGYSIISGEEYRTSTFGHMNLFLLDHLVAPRQSYNANDWPPYGHIGQRVREAGGLSFYAHGGYAKEIYADVVQGNIDGVELLQFGVYRGIGLIDWYNMLNAGFRVPATGACDYPACRKLGDAKTFVYNREKPTVEAWLRGMAEGRCFFSSGPLLLFEVDGRKPGSRIEQQTNGKPIRVTARVNVRSEVAPVTHVQFIANGRIVKEVRLPSSAGQGNWIELAEEIELEQSAWIAVRAFSLSRHGTPDADAHTNPVFVYLDGKAPYDRQSLDALVAAIDKQIDFHEKRKFAEQAKVIAYFERSRDILMKIREAGGAASSGHPSDIAGARPQKFDPGAREHTAEQLKAFLQPTPPKPMEQVLRSFEAVDGFQMQLVAREPFVKDPIAAAFDEFGNLYVCEMRDYPYKPQAGKKPIGSLRLLKDTDGDGVFDESHVFAEHLLWTGGVAPFRGGVFVAAPPDIWYLKDTDGDNRADVREKVFTGFGTGNQQAMVNNLKWGLDHKIYGSTAHNGGVIRPGDAPNAPGISVQGRDFRFDPVTRQFETITGTVQFGNTFDDWGNRFLCSESQPLQHAVMPQHYLARNPYLPVPRAVLNIAPGPVPSFRISPLERWRQIRSSRRIAHGQRAPTAAGASHHVIDAAAGVTVYRGGAYPQQYYGNIFIGGAQSNLIHRRTLTPSGVTFKSQRADAETEFIRSSDNWFRPVNFVNAPDGTLYALDMSREILETIHVPIDVTKFIDFRHGREHGRIYRIAPNGFQFPGPPRVGVNAAELVAHLESPHGWWRETAHRLIYERQDRAAVEPLRRLLRASGSPQARLHALWSLQGLEALTDADVIHGLEDQHPAIREHAMRLAEPRLDAAPKLLERLLALASDSNTRIQLQLAFSLGESRSPRAAAALAALAKKHAGDVWIRTAVLSSANGLADRMFVAILEDPAFARSGPGQLLLRQLLSVAAARGKQDEVDRILNAIVASEATRRAKGLQNSLVSALASGMQNETFAAVSQNSPAADFVRELLDSAAETAGDDSKSEAERITAIQLLASAEFNAVGATLASLVDVRHAESLQLAGVRSLSRFSQPAVSRILLDRWRGQSPAVRQRIIEVMLSREDRTLALLKAAESGVVSLSSIELPRRSLLQKHKNDAIRELAVKLFGAPTSGSKNALIADYEAALSLRMDAARGQKVFQRDCIACHRVADVGHPVGPDLTSSSTRDAKALIAHVLDPNRYVLPNYEQYTCIDANGRIVTGMIVAQTATSITFKREGNKTETVLRGNIEELTSSGKSLMPEGLEAKLSKQDMADLIAWLQTAKPAKPTGDAPLHIGTLPGLIEPSDN